jgi:hypothetical protein
LPRQARWLDESVLWLPVIAVLVLVSAQRGFSRHGRYVLPIIPFVVVSVSKLGRFWDPATWTSGVAVAMLLTYGAASSLAVHPHALSYFNEIGGGPHNGHNHLVDSNCDWGQDLLFLKKWLEEHPEARPLRLAYFHLVDPRVIGIDYEVPPFGPHEGTREPNQVGPRPGWYAVSVNYICGAP